MKICSVAVLKAYLEIAVADTSFDTLLGGKLDGVSSRMQGALNRQLIRGTYTEYYPTPCKTLYLKARPATVITSVAYQDNPIQAEFYDEDLELAAIYFDDWVTDTETQRGMKIVYTGGYAYSAVVGETDVLVGLPGDVHLARLVDAVKKQAAYEFWRRRDLGISSFTMPDGTITKVSDDPWLKAVMDIISLERRPTFG